MRMRVVAAERQGCIKLNLANVAVPGPRRRRDPPVVAVLVVVIVIETPGEETDYDYEDDDDDDSETGITDARAEPKSWSLPRMSPCVGNRRDCKQERRDPV